MSPVEATRERWIAGPTRVAPLDDEQCVLTAQAGQKLRIAVHSAQLEKWLALIDGTRTEAALMNAAPVEPFAEVWHRLVADGVVQPVADSRNRSWYRQLPQRITTTRLQTYTFALTGSPHLTRFFEAALSGAGLRVCIADEAHPTLAGDGDPHVIACPIFQNESWATLVAADDAMDEAGITRIPIRVVDHKIFAGPAMRPGTGPSLSDVLRRRKAAATSAPLFELDHVSPQPVDDDRFRDSEMAWAAATLAVQIERWLAGAARSELASAELVLDLAQQTVEHHGVLAMPDRVDRRRPSRRTNVWNLRDPETGIVRSVKVHPTPPHLPSRLHIAVARAADMRRVMDFHNDLTSFGSSWDDPDAAVGPAVGELIERYCANWRDPATVQRWGSFDDLRRAGCDAVDPETLAGYSPAQLDQRGFPFRPLSRATELTWIPGRGLVSGDERWVPACWTYVSWFDQKPANEPRLLYPNLSGIAGGRSLDEAAANALLETIERDASMIWWANTPTRLHKVDVREFAPDLVGAWSERFDCAVVEISFDFGVSTVAACVCDTQTSFLAIGFAARATFAEAARKALAEGFGLHWTGMTMRDAAAGTPQADVLSSLRNLKPHRADLAYLDSYRSDFRDVTDLACQLQIYLDPRALQRVRPWTLDLGEGPAPQRAATRPGTPEIAGALLARFDEEPVVVDLTTPDVREAGFAAVRVLSPGLVPNFPAAFPQYGTGRVMRGAVDLGWQATPLDEDDVNTFPLAHF